jgi:hypothetical protein
MMEGNIRISDDYVYLLSFRTKSGYVARFLKNDTLSNYYPTPHRMCFNVKFSERNCSESFVYYFKNNFDGVLYQTPEQSRYP